MTSNTSLAILLQTSDANNSLSSSDNLRNHLLRHQPTTPSDLLFRDKLKEYDANTSLVIGVALENTTDGQVLEGSGGIWGLGGGQTPALQVNTTVYLDEGQQGGSWLSPYAIYALMITSGSMGLLVLLINICLLVASKFASGGRTPMLIFLRSLCVADALIGIFGVLKMTQFIPAMAWEWANCFLPESVLFSATIASNLTHVMLSTMCFSMLKDMVRFDRKQDKHRSIFSMTFLWNGSFVLGFAPHMDWNLEDHMGWNSVNRKCLFLRYVTQGYLGLVTAIISLCIVWLLVVHIGVQVLICRNKFQEPSLLELTAPVIYATRVDIALQLTCYLPGALYIFLSCDSCAYVAEQQVANDNLSALLPLMIVRATCSTALHFKRTDQMRDIIYYCLKVIKHHVMFRSGSKSTIRPVRPSIHRPSMRRPSTSTDLNKSPKMLPSSPPQKGNSFHQSITVPKVEKVKVMSNAGGMHHSTPSKPAFSASQPTIAEETLEVEGSSQVEDLSPAMSSAPSWSTSDITLASTLGSTSGGSSNGISPFTRQKSVTKPAMNQNGVKTVSASGGKPAGPLELKDLTVPGNPHPHNPLQYWVGEIPKRNQANSQSPPKASAPKVLPPLEDSTSVPASPQRRMLWAKSHLGLQFNPSPQLKTSTERPSQIQNDKMDILSARRLDADFGKWKIPKGNTLLSEVIVHVPAETRFT